MRAVTTGAGDGIPVVGDRPEPAPGAGEVLVRVRACGLNNADLLQLRGGYPAPPGVPADIPGLEFAGEVVGVGPGATRFSPGDRVMAVVGGGGQAELAVVHERAAMPVPDEMGWDEAGGFPEVFTTAHDALFTQAHLAMGERVCISGAAGGVGTAGVQLAAATGASVVATVRRSELREAVEALGPDVVAIDPSELRAHGPFDVILELIGGPNLGDDLSTLATGGRISVIGVGGGATAEINLLALMAKRGQITASTLRTRPLEAKADAARRVERHALPLVASGGLRVPIVATYPLADAAEAYARFAAGGKLGKIVLLPA
jgi:NADPH:quinone reductase-like Zn-dependent oxidoreductase